MYKNRAEAGKALAKSLQHYAKAKNTYVMGIAPGGLIVASEVAKALSLPFNIALPERLLAPDSPDLVVGALSEQRDMWLDEEVILQLNLAPDYVYTQIDMAKKRIQDATEYFRVPIPHPDLTGKQILLINDGVTTGALMLIQLYSYIKHWSAHPIPIAPVSSAFGWNRIVSFQKTTHHKSFCPHIEPAVGKIAHFYTENPPIQKSDLLQILQS